MSIFILGSSQTKRTHCGRIWRRSPRTPDACYLPVFSGREPLGGEESAVVARRLMMCAAWFCRYASFIVSGKKPNEANPKSSASTGRARIPVAGRGRQAALLSCFSPVFNSGPRLAHSSAGPALFFACHPHPIVAGISMRSTRRAIRG